MNSLIARTLSALVLAPPVLAAVWFGSPYFEGLILLSAGIMAWEWELIVTRENFGNPGIALGICSLIALFLLFFSPFHALIMAGLGAVIASLIAPVGKRSWMAAGAFYIFLPLAALLMLRAIATDSQGRDIILWLLLIVWATDIGAYAAGLTIGGPKLAPAISPKKTWAGLLGGVAAAALVSIWSGHIFEFPAPGIKLALLGGVLAVLAQVGDLFESFVKRHFDVKDSSRLIPGHGGFLDRVDGLLAAGLALGLFHLATFTEEGGFAW